MTNRQRRIQQRLRLLSQVERRGDPFIRELTRSVAKAALAGLRDGKVKVDTERLITRLAELMVEGYVLRFAQEKAELHLSFASDVRKIARRHDLVPSGLRDSFARSIDQRVRKATADISNRLNNELGRIAARQLPTRQATREMRRSLDRMGLSLRSPSAFLPWVRTHSQIAFNAAQYQIDKEADTLGLILSYTYVTVGDNRVREEHAELDGLTRPVDDPIWETIWPPNGYNCRCQILTNTDEVEITDVPPHWNEAVTPGFDFNPGLLMQS